MRILLKPEISSWRIFDFGGRGTLGEFWLPPLIVLIALFAFYLEGRGRYRPLFHSLLVIWHLLLTGLCVYGILQTDTMISFGTWGISFSIVWLLFPVALFSVLSIMLVIQEMRISRDIPVFGWQEIDWKVIGLAGLLLPVAFFFFYVGTGFNIWVKIAVAVTVVQWILLVEALGRPAPAKAESIEKMS